MRVAVLFITVLAFAGSCASATARRPSFRAAPASFVAKTNPYAHRADATLAGRKLFLQDCAQCHGVDAQGSMAAPSLRTRDIQSTPPGALTWFLANGDLRHGMPSWSHMPEERRWQIVTYLQSLRP